MSKQKHSLCSLCKNQHSWHQQTWLWPTHCFQTLNWIKMFIDTRSVCLPWVQTNIWHVLKTSWLQLGKTTLFLWGEVFLLLLEGVFSANVFVSCLAAPSSPAGRTTSLIHVTLSFKQTLLLMNLLSAFLSNHRRSSYQQLINYSSDDDALTSSTGGCQESHSFQQVTSDSRYLCQETLFKYSLMKRQVAQAHLSIIATYLVAMYGWNVCDC